MQVNLTVDYTATMQDPLVDSAIHQIERLWQNPEVHIVHGSTEQTISALCLFGQSIKSLDKLMEFLGDFSEVRIQY